MSQETEYEMYKRQKNEMLKRSKEYLPNCLSYALRFWEKNNEYEIWYNSGHCINLPKGVAVTTDNLPTFLPATQYGYDYFSSAFKGLITDDDEELLKKYFKL